MFFTEVDFCAPGLHRQTAGLHSISRQEMSCNVRFGNALIGMNGKELLWYAQQSEDTVCGNWGSPASIAQQTEQEEDEDELLMKMSNEPVVAYGY